MFLVKVFTLIKIIIFDKHRVGGWGLRGGLRGRGVDYDTVGSDVAPERYLVGREEHTADDLPRGVHTNPDNNKSNHTGFPR